MHGLVQFESGTSVAGHEYDGIWALPSDEWAYVVECPFGCCGVEVLLNQGIDLEQRAWQQWRDIPKAEFRSVLREEYRPFTDQRLQAAYKETA